MATKSAHPISSSATATLPPNGRSDRPERSDDRPGKLHRMPRTLAGTPLSVDDGDARKSLLALYE